MALYLIAVPIGNPGDITARAIDALKTADVVIGEERKEVSKLLKSLGIEGKRLELLNEHSSDADVEELLRLCHDHNVALVSDCGTPGFCDPGARLVAGCRTKLIANSPLPGASSLMCLLSICGHDMREFLFRGFLPAEREERKQALNELDRERRPVIFMDTPYRLGRLLTELAGKWPERQAVLGCDFTQSTETVFEARLKDLPQLVAERKAEFIIAVYPGANEVIKRAPVLASRAVVKPREGQKNGPNDGRHHSQARRRR